MNVYQQALRWHEQGHSVIPIENGTKRPALTTWREYRLSLPHPARLRYWFESGRHEAYGLILGRFGLTVLDFDQLELYEKWLAWAREGQTYADVIACYGYTVFTSRGAHVYVKCQAEARSRRYEGLDLKATGGYVLGEGSRHPFGSVYTLVPDGALFEIPEVECLLPAWLVPKAANSLSPTRQCPQQIMPSRGGEDAFASADAALTTKQLKALAKQIPAWEVLGVTPKPSGAGKGIARCPFHDDHDPSLSCDLVTNRVSCFAGCTGAHGWDAADAYQHRYRVDFVTALRELAQGRR